MKEFKLPKEFATKWVEALRSDKFKQNKEGYLLNDDKYCCLGVACHIAGIDDCEIKGSRLIVNATIDEKWTELIPQELRGYKMEGTLVNEVTEMNDIGKSFHAIAHWIEQNVEFV